MDKCSNILLIAGLSIWVTLYSLWAVLEMPFLYFLGQSVIMLVSSVVIHRQFKTTLTAIFLILSANQFIDEICLYGIDFRWSEYISVASIIIYLLLRNDKR